MPTTPSLLQDLLAQHTHERVCVVGTTCTGKSTLVKQIPGLLDMDDCIFPLLSPKEQAQVCTSPWTEEIGKTMTRLVRERVAIQPGRPVIGTVVIESDFIIYLKIAEKLLRQRTKQRGASYHDAKNMQKQIEKDILSSHIQYVELLIT